MPATGGLELELQLCPRHRTEVERGLEAAHEAVFQSGLRAEEAAIRKQLGRVGVVRWA
jgi:hypothetical protein